jgi:hypothetical protein
MLIYAEHYTNLFTVIIALCCAVRGHRCCPSSEGLLNSGDVRWLWQAGQRGRVSCNISQRADRSCIFHDWRQLQLLDDTIYLS